jgi:hypothetical protein
MPSKRDIQQAIYDRENTRRFNVKLNLKTDADIIARIEEQAAALGGIQAYIKQVIRADIAANGGAPAPADPDESK